MLVDKRSGVICEKVDKYYIQLRLLERDIILKKAEGEKGKMLIAKHAQYLAAEGNSYDLREYNGHMDNFVKQAFKMADLFVDYVFSTGTVYSRNFSLIQSRK